VVRLTLFECHTLKNLKLAASTHQASDRWARAGNERQRTRLL